MKILFLAANPPGSARLALDTEVSKIEDGLQRSKLRDQFELISRWAVDSNTLRRTLLEENPDIVHFSGHGYGESGLVLVGQDGQAKPATGEALSGLFKHFPNVQCVLLNACYAEIQAKAIVQHVNYVVGMRQAVRDDAAIAFATGFYDGLGYGRSIDEAFELGCNAIQFELTSFSATTRKFTLVDVQPIKPLPDDLIPVLLKRNTGLTGNLAQSTPTASQISSFEKPQAIDKLTKEDKHQIYRERVQEFLVDQRLTRLEKFQLATLANVLEISDAEAHRILQEEQSKLTLTPPPRRFTLLITSLLLFGCVFAGTYYGYRYWLSSQGTQEPPPRESDQGTQEPSPPGSGQGTQEPLPPESDQGKQELSPSEIVDEARKAADRERWDTAIAWLKTLPPNDPLTKKTEPLLNDWSEKLLNQAEKVYQDGNVNEAIRLAQIIPSNSSYFENAKNKIESWQKDAENFQKVWNGLTKQWAIRSTKQQLDGIRSVRLRKQLVEKIADIQKTVDQKATQQLKTAEGYFNNQEVDKAIKTAQQISPESSSYQEAQAKIKIWKIDPVVRPRPVPSPIVLYPWLAEREVTQADLAGKSNWDLQIMRNSIYARHGYIFQSPKLQKFFSAQPWYKPIYTDDSTVYNSFNDIEKQNIKIIQEAE